MPSDVLEWHCKLNKLTKQNTEFSKEKKEMKNLNKVLGAVENVGGEFSFKLDNVLYDDNSNVWAKEFEVSNDYYAEYITVYMKHYKGKKIVKLDKRRKPNQREFSVYKIIGSEKVYDNDVIFGNARLYNAYVELINKLLEL